MNKFTHTVIFCFLFAYSHAQYFPMISEDNTWKGIMYGFFVSDFYEEMEGDSVIGTQTYKKVYYGQSLGQHDFLVALIREDSTEQKVYIFSGSEYQLYDFNVQIGNQVSTYGISGQQTITVTNMTTVMVNGTERRVVHFEDFGGPAYWVEGIGSVYGIADGALGPVADYNPWLSCFYIVNDLRWENPMNDNPCALSLAITETPMTALEIFPNPASDRISMHVPMVGNDLFELTISTSTGQIVSVQKLTQQGLQTVDISALKSGFYTLSLMSGDQWIGVSKVCVEQ